MISIGLSGVLSKLADIFIDYDVTLVEINPLALTGDGQLIALDCHLEIDDDALFRHKEMAKIEQDDTRVESAKSMTEFERKDAEIDNLDHRGVAGRVIELDGSQGLIIGGGGASLTAFDAIESHGCSLPIIVKLGAILRFSKSRSLPAYFFPSPMLKRLQLS